MRSPTPVRTATVPAVLLTLCLVGTAVTACGDDGVPAGTVQEPTCTPMPSEPVVLEGRAATFDLSGLAEPTNVVSQDGYLVINARAEGKVTDLVIPFQTVVTDAGFDVAGSDDEGFEAEVFFARGDIAAGQVVLTESNCADRVEVKISVLDNPAVFPDDSGTPPG